MGLQVTCTCMTQGTPPDPCLAVIFGASGDLAQNTLIPSLYALASQRFLPDPFAIIGMSRREWNDETFRDVMRDIVNNKIAFREDVWEKFGRGLYYIPGDLRSAENYVALREKVKKVQAQQHLPNNILYHCATPPSKISASGHSGISERPCSPRLPRPWDRLFAVIGHWAADIICPRQALPYPLW
jgi:glucose-6-phosphate 1-dehydrogenase